MGFFPDSVLFLLHRGRYEVFTVAGAGVTLKTNAAAPACESLAVQQLEDSASVQRVTWVEKARAAELIGI